MIDFMTKDVVKLRYDGPVLAGHSMDVNDLAPALLALGDLCTRANKKFNDNRASVRVLVNADLAQNCFELNLELVQSLLDQARSLIDIQDVATAKDIFEWLGIVGAVAGTPIGLFKLVKLLGGKKIQHKEMVVENGRDVIRITIEGDNNHVDVHPQAMNLLEDKPSIKAVKKVVEPLLKSGYETVEFDSDNDDEESEIITKDEAKEIIDADLDFPFDEIIEDDPQVITAWVRVYSPVYSQNVKNWMFQYGNNYEYIDISETDIASQAMQRGGALLNDTYRVKLEITQLLSNSGTYTNHFKIKEVLEFKPANLMIQKDLFRNPD